jgi:cysteinyl-tRNA synthetase
MLYRHFLAYQGHLDEVGASLDREGKDGSQFRDHYQQKLGFTNEAFAPVRSAALRLNSALNNEDAKIKAAIDAFRAQHPRKLASPFDLPRVPEELKQLQKEKDTIIQNEVDQLNGELGPERAAKLQALIQNDFAPNVHVYSTHNIPHHDPSKNPLPQFPQGVQP